VLWAHTRVNLGVEPTELSDGNSVLSGNIVTRVT
jgi:hypothetical protein